jgi:hypothetical protein
MRTRSLIPLALIAGFAGACTDAKLGPTATAGSGPLFDHFSGHEPGNHHELTLSTPEDWTGATLVTAEKCGWSSVMAEGHDRTLRAGVQDVSDGDDVRFQLSLSGVEYFGTDPVCLGNLRDNGDWRHDFIIEYRQRGRNDPEVAVVWHFQHEGETHDLRTGWTRIASTWDEVLTGTTTLVEGAATIRKGRTTVESGVLLAFEFTAEGQGGGGGGGGGDQPCHRNPNHPCHNR